MAPLILNAVLAVLPALALSAPTLSGRSGSNETSSTPTVDLDCGTYVGVSNKHYDQEFFLGIPYAQPPTGPLRFAAPQAIQESWDEPRNATEHSDSDICYGYGSDTATLLGLGDKVSEDCLTLNIVRPAGVEVGDDLPVSIWVHGGSYTNGASSDPRYNLSYIVRQSVQQNKPIVAASINYRLDKWGFLFSEEMKAAGAGNIASRDQRLAFQWIHDNVAAFGGSSNKFTVWAESAGARSLGMHLIAYDGKHDGLFQGAILESGSPVTKFVEANAWQPYFDGLVAKTGCNNATDHLGCLRELPAQTLNAVFNSTTALTVTAPPLSAALDGDFHDSAGIRSEAYLAGLDLGDGTVDEIAALYPDDPDVGIPASQIGRPAAYPYGLQWKRAAAFAGDWQQHASRRLLAETYAEAGFSVYSYLWNVYVDGVTPMLGSTHFQEVAFAFHDLTSLEFEGKPDTFKQLSKLMSNQWVSFINDDNPNLSTLSANSTEWPLYTPSTPDNIVFDVNRTGLAYTTEDNYRSTEITYLQQNVYK